MKFNSSKWLTYAVTFVSLMLMAMPAFAGPFEVPAGDKSKEIFIDTLFGPLTGAGGTSPLSAVITIFNQAMLFVGGILVAYTLIAGTMSTAHDGEMLGKRWSSMWVPVRTALGTAAILPVLPGGFCAAQGAVVWLALQGVGLADRLMAAYIGNGQDLFGQAFYEPPSVQKPIRQLLESMLVSNACVAAINGNISSTDQAAVDGFGLNDLQAQAATIAGGALTYEYGRLGVCGRVTLLSADPVMGTFTNAAYGSLQSAFDTRQYSMALEPVNIAQLQSAQSRLEALGRRIHEGSDGDAALALEVRQTLDQIALQWSTALYDTGKSTYANAINTDFLNNIREDGWLMLGAWYMEIAKIQDAVAKGVTSVPNGVAPSILNSTSQDNSLTGTLGVGTLRSVAQLVAGYFSGADITATVNRAHALAASSTGPGGAVEDFANSNTNTWTARIVSWFINDDNNLFGTNIGGGMNQNPVLMARNLGQNMTLLGWTAYGTSAAAVVLGTQSAAGVGTSGLAAMVSPMITALAGTIIVSGATLSTYIPMLPYILWIGVALGWAVLLVEAVIAAPLWAVTHLAPDGDGVVGRGGQGYMLVLSLVLRPGLMVLGFVCAVILMNPLGLLINSTFMGAFLNGVNPSIFGLSQMIMGCVLYVVVMVSVITRVFALIHVIPDKILRWIGGGAADLGETAHGIESNTAAKVMAGAHVGQQMGGGMLTGAQNLRSNRLQQQQINEGKASGAAQELGNAQDRLAQNQNEMEIGLDDARKSTTPEGLNSASQRVRQAQGANSVAAFGAAQASARAASARGGTPRATEEEKALGVQADHFLAAARQVNSFDAQATQSFMAQAQKTGAFSSTPWGNIMAKSNADRAYANDTLGEIRGNFQAQKSQEAGRQPDPNQGDLFDQNNGGGPNNDVR